MSLSSYKVEDVDRRLRHGAGRRSSTTGTLRPRPRERIRPTESRVYACGGDTSLHVYASPRPRRHGDRDSGHLVRGATSRQVVDELRSNGVTFEHYDDPALAER